MTSGNVAVEREVKLRIDSRADYERFARVLPPPRRWGLQLNAYLDTDDRRLRTMKVSLRVRITPDHARLTMKTPWGLGFDGGGLSVKGREYIERAAGGIPEAPAGWERDSSGAFVHRETEIELDRDLAVAWVQNPTIAVPWEFVDFEGLRPIVDGRALAVACWSLTRRAICDTPSGITVELDETVFADGFRDFEVELEHPDSEAAVRLALDYAARAGIVLRTQELSKHARARAHRGDIPWKIPSAGPTDPMPPLFPDPAPVWLFVHD